MAFYDDMQKISTGLLTTFNQGTISLVRITPGNGPGYNPGAPTRTVVPLKATALGVSKFYVAQGLADQGDLNVTAAIVAGVTPDMVNDRVMIDGVDWKIVSFQIIPPAGTPVTWKFQVRR